MKYTRRKSMTNSVNTKVNYFPFLSFFISSNYWIKEYETLKTWVLELL